LARTCRLIQAYLEGKNILGAKESEPDTDAASKKKTFVTTLQNASLLLKNLPALCLLFLATRLHANAKDGSVDYWIGFTMYAVSIGVACEYVFKAIVPPTQEWVGDYFEMSAQRQKASWLGIICAFLGFVANAVVNGGTAVLIVAIVMSERVPSFTTQCIAWVLSVYFAAHMLLSVHAVCLSCTPGGSAELRPPKGNRTASKLFTQVLRIQDTLALFPMLCVILVCLRMRVLELDQEPPHTAMSGMTIIVFASTLQVLAVIAQGLCGEMSCCGQYMAMSLSAIETACLVILYGGVGATMVGLVKLDALPNGFTFAQLDAVPVPTSMKCVAVLSILYFGAYFSVLVARMLQYVYAVAYNIDTLGEGRMETIMNETTKVVMFVPMLSVMMIALRLRAQTIGQTDPPMWSQHAMWVAVWALITHIIVAPLGSLYAGMTDFRTGPNARQAFDSDKTIAMVIFLCKYVSQAIFYGSVTALFIALVTL